MKTIVQSRPVAQAPTETCPITGAVQEFALTATDARARHLLWLIAKGTDQYLSLPRVTFDRRITNGRMLLEVHNNLQLSFNGTTQAPALHILKVSTSERVHETDVGLSGDTLEITLPARIAEETLIGIAALCIDHIEGKFSSMVPDYHPRQSTMLMRT